MPARFCPPSRRVAARLGCERLKARIAMEIEGETATVSGENVL